MSRFATGQWRPRAEAEEEELLQISGAFSGHRYLFGLIRLGGLSRDWSAEDIQHIVKRLETLVHHSQEILDALTFDNSFLDRLEAVGTLSGERARTHGLVGPVGRASGIHRDVRIHQPYAAYDNVVFDVPVQTEGDGYARFRQLAQEMTQSIRIIQQIPSMLTPGEVVPTDKFHPALRTAFGYVESPGGSVLCAVSSNNQGMVERCRIITPGLVNWHAFPDAIRHFAFQDFPIIMATFGLSVADLDR